MADQQRLRRRSTAKCGKLHPCRAAPLSAGATHRRCILVKRGSLTATTTTACLCRSFLGRTPLLARNLIVEAAESDAERLQATERPLIVHREGILAHATKLHDDVISCVAQYHRTNREGRYVIGMGAAVHAGHPCGASDPKANDVGARECAAYDPWRCCTTESS